jgi:hypothetical protein
MGGGCCHYREENEHDADGKSGTRKSFPKTTVFEATTGASYR